MSMFSRADFNRQQIVNAAHALAELTEEVVFLGGAVTTLFVTEQGAPEPRSTKDVDVLLEVGSRLDYYRIEDRLRQKGFSQPLTGDDPICRWQKTNVVIDVMPTEPSILGFSNSWYPEAMLSCERFVLTDNLSIRLITPPVFICTKIEAFHKRGNGDFMLSHDIQDIVFLVDGRTELQEEVLLASPDARAFLSSSFFNWLSNPAFCESLAGHLPFDSASQARLPLVIDRMKRFCDAA